MALDQMSTPTSSSSGGDIARGNYLDVYPPPKLAAPLQSLKDIGEDTVGKTVQVRAWIQKTRMQGAKMAFVELREERSLDYPRCRDRKSNWSSEQADGEVGGRASA